MQGRFVRRLASLVTLLTVAVTGVVVNPAPAQAAWPAYGICTGSKTPQGVSPPVVRDGLGRGPFPTKWCVVDHPDGSGGLLYWNPADIRDASGAMNNGVSWFICQKPVWDEFDHSYWWHSYTQGDHAYNHGGWGWMANVWMSGGSHRDPTPGLINCSAYGI